MAPWDPVPPLDPPLQCDVACLSPVLLWPEKMRGSFPVCVRAAVHVVPVTFCSSVPPYH